jgi:hypothetical protein
METQQKVVKFRRIESDWNQWFNLGFVTCGQTQAQYVFLETNLIYYYIFQTLCCEQRITFMQHYIVMRTLLEETWTNENIRKDLKGDYDRPRKLLRREVWE